MSSLTSSMKRLRGRLEAIRKLSQFQKSRVRKINHVLKINQLRKINRVRTISRVVDRGNL